MTEPRTEPRNRICRSHCTRCNLCFAGDTAFDMHIADGEHTDPYHLRYKAGTKREGELKLDHKHGTCSHQAGCWANGRLVKTIPTLVYSVAMTPEQKAGLAALNGVAK